MVFFFDYLSFIKPKIYSVIRKHSPDFTSKAKLFLDIKKLENQKSSMNQPDMEEYLQLIDGFGDALAKIFKQFSQICRDHLKKTQNSKTEVKDLRAQLIEERKKRHQLDNKLRTIISGETVPRQNEPVEEKNRPKNAFALFMADQRDKILVDHPTLNFSKISSLAVLKWNNMSEEQKRPYQKKFEEMKKFFEKQQKEANNPNKTSNTQAHLVKREDNEEDLRGDEEQKAREENREINEDYMRNEAEEGGPTLVIQQENQATIAMEPEERPPQALHHILGLFHTPAQSQPAAVERDLTEGKPEQSKEDNQVYPNLQPEEEKKQDNEPIVNATELPEQQDVYHRENQENETQGRPQENVVIESSVQIVSQVVIDPTLPENEQK